MIATVIRSITLSSVATVSIAAGLLTSVIVTSSLQDAHLAPVASAYAQTVTVASASVTVSSN